MSKNINNKKVLAEKLKTRLNSPEYVEVPDLITPNDRGKEMMVWILGENQNIHKKNNWKKMIERKSLI
jgi:hypothetical protein